MCPCCGFPPVAGIVRMDGDVPGRRYLHCTLCNTEWYFERVTCAACRDSSQVSYYYIEGGSGAVGAEACGACKSYLKILYQKKSPQGDPVADDLSSVSLDLLMDEAGYGRMSPNLLFTVPGDNCPQA
jgi:FdhE protein